MLTQSRGHGIQPMSGCASCPRKAVGIAPSDSAMAQETDLCSRDAESSERVTLAWRSSHRGEPRTTGPAEGAGSRTGAKRATASSEAYPLGLDSVWPRCGGVPDPLPLDWPFRRLPVTP